MDNSQRCKKRHFYGKSLIHKLVIEREVDIWGSIRFTNPLWVLFWEYWDIIGLYKNLEITFYYSTWIPYSWKMEFRVLLCTWNEIRYSMHLVCINIYWIIIYTYILKLLVEILWATICELFACLLHAQSIFHLYYFLLCSFRLSYILSTSWPYSTLLSL